MLLHNRTLGVLGENLEGRTERVEENGEEQSGATREEGAGGGSWEALAGM